MSLINDYLKSIGRKLQPGDGSAEIPPSLRRDQKSSGGFRVTGRVAIGAGAVGIAGLLLAWNLTAASRIGEQQVLMAEVTAPAGPSSAGLVVKEQTVVRPVDNEPKRAPSPDPEPQSDSGIDNGQAGEEKVTQAAVMGGEIKLEVSAVRSPAVPVVASPKAATVTTGDAVDRLEPLPLDESLMAAMVHGGGNEPAVSSEAVVRVVSVSSRERSDVADRDGKTVGYLYQSALQAQRANRQDQAIKLYKQVLGNQPNHKDAILNLSAIYIELGLYDHAGQMLDGLQTIDPGNSEMRVNRGMIALKSNELSIAQQYFRQAIDINPTEKTALINLAWLAMQEGESVVAAGYYQMLNQIYQEDSAVCLAYANSLEVLKRYGEAAESYTRCLSLSGLQQQSAATVKIRDRIVLLKRYGADNQSASRPQG